MQASTKFSKAIHICIYLNVNRDHTVSSNELADSLLTHSVVIRQLIGLLKNKGILKTSIGSSGGVELAKSPSDITLWDLYKATREDGLFKRPNKINPDCIVSSNLNVLVHDSFTTAEMDMQNTLAHKTIDQLTHHLHEIVGGPALKKGK